MKKSLNDFMDEDALNDFLNEIRMLFNDFDIGFEDIGTIGINLADKINTDESKVIKSDIEIKINKIKELNKESDNDFYSKRWEKLKLYTNELIKDILKLNVLA